MKYFFRFIRTILGPFLLLEEYLMRPKGVERTPAAQRDVDAACGKLALYQFNTCPFCIKVRQAMRRLSLSIELLDAQGSKEHRDTLLAQGGSPKVPCLRITREDGIVQWLYESRDIMAYLDQRFSAAK